MNHRLLQLLVDNRGVPKGDGMPRRFEVKDATDLKESTVYVYDVICASQVEAEWFGGVAAEPFVREFAKITAPVIHLRVNSPGGDVFAGRAMAQAINEHPSKVIAHVDGYAASAASVLIMAADEIEIAEGGCIMIHNSWSWAMGNAADMRKTADLLDQIDTTLVATYAKRTGIDPKKIKQMMDDETWIFAEEAVAEKWADRESQTEDKKAQVNWNVNALLNKPKRAAPVDDNPQPAANTDSRDVAERKQRHFERIAA